MARKAPKMAADGLPEALPVRPVFRPLAMVLGAVGGLAFVLLMQQAGKMLISTGSLLTGLLLGLVAGILLPSIPYILAARHVNHVVADERKKRAAAGAARPSSAEAMPATTPPQGGA